MNLGLCLIVRDEAHNIAACLDPIIDLFSDVVVVDTGSEDGTLEILTQQFGVAPMRYPIDRDFCFKQHEARNAGFEAVRAPWILSLDADERIARNELKTLIEHTFDPGVAGCFLKWITHSGGSALEDYKLALFRKGFKSLGLVHENVQQDMRARGGKAIWHASPVIDHHPDPARLVFKRQFYIRRLIEAVARNPDWIRYHWFLGYAYFREGNLEDARRFLQIAAASRSAIFPVECLNAHLVLTEICARAGDVAGVRAILDSASSLFAEVRSDFEVQVNFRLKPWLDKAQIACDMGRLQDISAYAFAG